MGILYNFVGEPPKSYTMPTFCPTCMEAEDLYKLLSISKGVALPALCPTKIEYAYPEAHGSLNFRKDEFLVMSQIYGEVMTARQAVKQYDFFVND